MSAVAPALLLKSEINPRYFTDGTNAVYLTGEHIPTDFNNWAGCPIIDFSAFTDNMVAKKHNFLRLWALDAPCAYHLDGSHGAITPNPFLRIGPGNAADGLPKFDLSQLNQSYFDRLRARVVVAGSKGIYVSVMLTSGIFVTNSNNFAYSIYSNPANNVNSGLSSMTNLLQYTMTNSAWVGYMDAYVDKVVDTVNDFDNVLYEISNEARPNTTDWQEHVIDRIHTREAGKPKQHFVGKTAFSHEASDSDINRDLLAGKADWVSLSGRTRPTYTTDVVDAPATKVSILDTDHIYGYDIPSAERVPWVWKAFTRGHNPIYITPQTDYPGGFEHYPEIENALGYAKTLADRIGLLHMAPADSLSSTGYCLAWINMEYVIYQPKNAGVTVNLPGGVFSYEWIDPVTGLITSTGQSGTINGINSFPLPQGMTTAVLHLVSAQDTDGDGMPDQYEKRNGFDIENSSDANLDSDGDSLTNVQEFIVGTNPNLAASRLYISSVTKPAASAALSFYSAAGKTYRLEYCDDLRLGNWIPLDYVFAGAADVIQVSDPGTAGLGKRFYRLLVEQ